MFVGMCTPLRGRGRSRHRTAGWVSCREDQALLHQIAQVGAVPDAHKLSADHCAVALHVPKACPAVVALQPVVLGCPGDQGGALHACCDRALILLPQSVGVTTLYVCIQAPSTRPQAGEGWQWLLLGY